MGFPHFSGVLRQPVTIKADYFDYRLMLAWENAAEIVDVLVNGRPVGVRPPPNAVISRACVCGHEPDHPASDQHGGECPAWPAASSGILGAVRIEPYARCEVKVPKD